jgi:hypothetical protein
MKNTMHNFLLVFLWANRSNFTQIEFNSRKNYGIFNYSLLLFVINFEKFQLCGLITLDPEFIRDSIKQIKKYGYRVKNRSYLRFCLAKSGILDVNNEKCYFLTQEKTTITNSSAKINYTDVKRIKRRKY